MNVRGRTVQFKLENQQNSADGIEAKMVTPRGEQTPWQILKLAATKSVGRM